MKSLANVCVARTPHEASGHEVHYSSPMATQTFGAPYQNSVLQREELTGLAALFASNLDGVPEAVRKEKATLAEALRQ